MDESPLFWVPELHVSSRQWAFAPRAVLVSRLGVLTIPWEFWVGCVNGDPESQVKYCPGFEQQPIRQADGTYRVIDYRDEPDTERVAPARLIGAGMPLAVHPDVLRHRLPLFLGPPRPEGTSDVPVTLTPCVWTFAEVPDVQTYYFRYPAPAPDAPRDERRGHAAQAKWFARRAAARVKWFVDEFPAEFTLCGTYYPCVVRLRCRTEVLGGPLFDATVRVFGRVDGIPSGTELRREVVVGSGPDAKVLSTVMAVVE